MTDCHWMSPLAAAVARVHASGERTLERQIALARIPAPTGAEHARGKALQRMLEVAGVAGSAGVHVREDGVGNVIVRVAPPDGDVAGARVADPVVCMAHLDTVFAADTVLEALRDGDCVQCPGIGDNGRGLAVLLALAEQFTRDDVREGMRRPIEFVATVGEEGEGNLRGARHYFDARAVGDSRRGSAGGVSSVLVLDGPGDGTIVHHAIGSTRLRFTYRGPGGHTWTDRTGPNPIHAMVGAIAATARLGATLPRDASVVVTRTGGGESLTAIAERAWYDVDVRALSPATLARVTTEVERIAFANAATCRCERLVLGDRPGGSLDADHPLVRTVSGMTRWCGVEPVSAMASTDANIPLARGIPAVAIGAGGRGGGAHTAAEWFDNHEGTRGIVRALGILAALSAN